MTITIHGTCSTSRWYTITLLTVLWSYVVDGWMPLWAGALWRQRRDVSRCPFHVTWRHWGHVVFVVRLSLFSVPWHINSTHYNHVRTAGNVTLNDVYTCVPLIAYLYRIHVCNTGIAYRYARVNVIAICIAYTCVIHVCDTGIRYITLALVDTPWVRRMQTSLAGRSQRSWPAVISRWCRPHQLQVWSIQLVSTGR